MIARLKGDPMPIRDMRPELKFPAAVERVLLRGMHREPTQRYGSATELAAALVEAAQGDAERHARPPVRSLIRRATGADVPQVPLMRRVSPATFRA